MQNKVTCRRVRQCPWCVEDGFSMLSIHTQSTDGSCVTWVSIQFLIPKTTSNSRNARPTRVVPCVCQDQKVLSSGIDQLRVSGEHDDPAGTLRLQRYHGERKVLEVREASAFGLHGVVSVPFPMIVLNPSVQPRPDHRTDISVQRLRSCDAL